MYLVNQQKADVSYVVRCKSLSLDEFPERVKACRFLVGRLLSQFSAVVVMTYSSRDHVGDK